jgi:hypothetical protein
MEEPHPRFHLCCIIRGDIASEWTSQIVGSFYTDKEAKYYLTTDTFAQEHAQRQQEYADPLIYFVLPETSTYVVQPGTVGVIKALADFPLLLPEDDTTT